MTSRLNRRRAKLALDSKDFTDLIAEAERLPQRLRDSRLSKRVPYPELPGNLGSLESQWRSIIWSIDQAEAYGKHALRGLAIALSQVIRADALKTLVMEAREHRSPSWSEGDLLWDDSLAVNEAGDTRRSLLIGVRRNISVDLNDAIVFAEPWERYRFHGALQKLGRGRIWGPWRQDPNNHFGTAWKPWPIVWVSNGNHSTLAALIRGGGKFKCQETYDFSRVLAAVDTDGESWIRRDTGNVLGPVRSIAMAGIFVIGQRLCGR